MTKKFERQDIDNPAYWEARLRRADKMRERHRAIFECTQQRWNQIHAKHREILKRLILPNESVLDAGCGYGRILDIMPDRWAGDYLGVDLSQTFVDEAAVLNPTRNFIVGPLELVLKNVKDRLVTYIGQEEKFDWCIACSMRDMIIRNNGPEAWAEIEGMLKVLCSRILYLEYDPEDNGSIE